MTGINQLSSTSDEMTIEIFPNPSANQLTLKWDSEIKQTLKIDLCDLNGKKLKTFERANNDLLSISQDEIPSGTYLINFSIGNTVIASRKVIKN